MCWPTRPHVSRFPFNSFLVDTVLRVRRVSRTCIRNLSIHSSLIPTVKGHRLPRTSGSFNSFLVDTFLPRRRAVVAGLPAFNSFLVDTQVQGGRHPPRLQRLSIHSSLIRLAEELRGWLRKHPFNSFLVDTYIPVSDLLRKEIFQFIPR